MKYAADARGGNVNDGTPQTSARAPGQRPDALTVYRRIIHDSRICHGAFRLWHYLRDRANKSGKCWPEQRTIARELRCKTHSLPGWTSQLVSCGYLAVRKVGQNHRLEYQKLFGDGRGGLPEWATRGKMQTVSGSPNAKVASPSEATPRVAAMGDRSNHKGVIPLKAYSTKASKLSARQKDLADRFET
ncbi:MAG: helix-turn-helix domain-containing protein, partial [Verrucomicrobiota bacterium]